MPVADNTKYSCSTSKLCAACGEIFTVRKEFWRTVCKPCLASLNKTKSQNKEPPKTKPCLGCGCQVRVSSNNIYCSKSCRSKHLRTSRVCHFCGKSFSVLKSSIGPATNASGNFCSKQCYTEHRKTQTGELNNNYNSVIQQCGTCKKDIKVINCKAGTVRFCSLDCRSAFHAGRYAGEKNPWWKGGHKNYREGFAFAKTKYFSGMLFCAKCGTTKKIHIHHIIPFRYTKDNSPSNLIPLCASCHRKVEIISWAMLENTDWGDMQLAKNLLNSTLREQQLITHTIIKQLIDERNEKAKIDNCLTATT